MHNVRNKVIILKDTYITAFYCFNFSKSTYFLKLKIVCFIYKCLDKI